MIRPQRGRFPNKRFPDKRFSVALLQIILLITVFAVGWKIVHRTPHISEDAYHYLLSLDAELILDAYGEGQILGSESWADIIAIRSTLQADLADHIISQLKQGVLWNRLDWGLSDQKVIDQVIARKEYLLKYPFYEPGRFVFPVIGDTWYTDTFGAEREGGRRTHEGTDLFSPEGTPIVSVCDGVVEKSGWNRLGGERVGVRGFDGNYYYYAHLKEIAPDIAVGKKVKKGEFLGTMGHTGDALTTPDHLHFGIELPNGRWINPYPFLVVWQKQARMAQE